MTNSEQKHLEARIKQAIECGIKRRSAGWTGLPAEYEVPENWNELLMEWNDNPGEKSERDIIWFARTLERVSIIELMSGDLRAHDNTRWEATQYYLKALGLEHVLANEEQEGWE